MPKACPYAMMKSQRLKHFFGGLLCEYQHFFGRLLCECLHFFGRLLCKVRFFIDNYQKLRFFIWDFLGEEMFCFCGGWLGSHRSHGSHSFAYVGGKSHGGCGWGGCVGCCLITPSALSAPIIKAHTRFEKNDLWEFVLICG